MRCEHCGTESPAMKTVRWRTGERRFTLCGDCYAPLADSLWIVRGAASVHGTCRICSGWFSLRELEDLRKGGRWDSSSGICSRDYLPTSARVG